MTSSRDAYQAEPATAETLSRHRGQICLNGVWSFVPTADMHETKPAGLPARIRVPGSWQDLRPWHGLPPVSSLVDGPGGGGVWDGLGDGSGASSAWYRRSVQVPTASLLPSPLDQPVAG